MQPWIEKAGSSGGQSNSLHYDKTLSHMNNRHHASTSSQQSGSGINSFRTSSSSSSRDKNNAQYGTKDFKDCTQDIISNHQLNNTYDFAAVHSNSAMVSMSDGSEVMSFLNSTSYSDAVYDDDLRPDSMTYISHRHQLDTQHALTEMGKLNQWTTELMATDDIVEYLRQTQYTEDIYGIPVLGQLIKEAKQELDTTGSNNKKAIERLSMIRNHLVAKALGDTELAAQNAFRMNDNDWSSTFLDSSI